MSEPTLDEVREAVEQLPGEILRELVRGPLVDPDDPDACRICELFDDIIYALAEFPWTGPALVLVDYHRFYADDGRSEKAYARCLEVYAFARRALSVRAFGDPPFDHVWFWRARLPERKGKRCRVLARGAKNSALVEFEDGYRTATSRYAVRKPR